MTSLPVRLESSLGVLLGDRSLREPVVLATIVSSMGSTYRKPGARMLIYADRSHSGLLSGGCLEGDLAEHAIAVLKHNQPRCVEYDLRGPDDALFGLGAGCQGALRILLEPAQTGSATAHALIEAEKAARQGKPCVLACVHDGPPTLLGTRALSSDLPFELQQLIADTYARGVSQHVEVASANGQALRVFADWIAPPPRVLVCGGGDDAQPLVKIMISLGWQVSVNDHRPRYAQAQRFLGAQVYNLDANALMSQIDVSYHHAAVVMSHHLESDAKYLNVLAASSGPPFVGLLGPRLRRDRLLSGDNIGLSDLLKHRLHSPVGLDLGAVTPEAIALSVVAQIHAFLAQRPGLSSR